MSYRNINLKYLFVLCLFFLFSCSKNEQLGDYGDGDIELVFETASISGEENVIGKRASVSTLNNNSPLATASTNVISNAGFSTDVQADQTLIGLSDSKINLDEIKSLNNKGINKTASVNPLPLGYTYRVLLYNSDTNELIKSFLARSGQAFSVGVVKGVKIKWYAFSYNDNLDIPEPADLDNPQVETQVDRDFMYASGTLDILKTPIGQLNKYPINIVFNHKVAQAKVKLDASSLALVANIQDFSVEFYQDNYFKKGVFSIKENKMGNLEVVPVKSIFSSANLTNIYEKSFYTADPSSLTEYRVDIKKLTVDFFLVGSGSGKVIDIANYNPNNTPKFTFKFTSPQAGQSLNGNGDLLYVLQSRRIFHVSDNTTYAYAMQEGPGWQMLRNLKNFGNLQESIVKMQPYNSQNPSLGVWKGGGMNDNKTSNWVLANSSNFRTRLLAELSDVANRPDILIIGYNQYNFGGNELVSAIINYVNEGGVLVFFNEFTTTDVNNLLNGIFDTQGMLAVPGRTAGAMYRLLNTSDDDRVLNGPFGDARGKLWGEDASTTHGVTGLPANSAFIYSYGQPINRPYNETHANMVTMFKHKTKNFFYLGDGGLVSYNGGTSATICPFDYDPVSGKPIPKLYGDVGQGYVARSEYAYNSVIAGNVMLWAAAIAEFNGIRPWKYD